VFRFTISLQQPDHFAPQSGIFRASRPKDRVTLFVADITQPIEKIARARKIRRRHDSRSGWSRE